MPGILYSCFGTTDPVRGMRDGGLLHILRYYRPDIVYLFLSKEIVDRDRKDQRVDKTFAYICDNWDGYAPQVIRIDTDIIDPSDMDILLDPMNDLFQRILQEHPKTEILLNLSSGTPQMQIILAQMAMDSRYRTRGIQVKSPEKASSTAERNNTKVYPVDESLELNEDEETGAPNRCSEPRLTAVRREAVRNQLNGLLSYRNYDAIARMGADLPAPIPKLARHLDYRSRFLLSEAESEAKGLSDCGLQAGRGVYSYSDYEMVEYFAVLKHLVQMKRYTDFMLRVNPFIIRLQTALMNQQLAPLGLTEQDLIDVSGGRKRFNTARMAAKIPALRTFIDNKLGYPLTDNDISIWVMNMVLEYFNEDSATQQVLNRCEQANRDLRNSAAHSLFTVTNDRIRNSCGADAETLVRGLEQVLLSVLARYNDLAGLKRRINIYDICDRKIRECL